jgi:hypothetical protein
VIDWGRRWRRDTSDPVIDTLIKPPVRKFAGADEALAHKTAQRRAAADSIRRRAEAVETGAAVSKVLAMVKRS